MQLPIPFEYEITADVPIALFAFPEKVSFVSAKLNGLAIRPSELEEQPSDAPGTVYKIKDMGLHAGDYIHGWYIPAK